MSRSAEDWKILREGMPCPECGGRMFPVMMLDEELDNHMVPTGRVRNCCSHMECAECMHMEVTDNDFLADEWRYVRS